VPGALSVHLFAFGGQLQDGSSCIGGIDFSGDVTPLGEPIEDAGECARVQAEDLCKTACGDAGEAAHDADDQSLCAGDAEVFGHALRRRL
jgi:hypothetical protein